MVLNRDGLINDMEKSSLSERNLKAQMAARFGQMRAELYRIGKPIGPYDMMLAWHAGSMGLILVSNKLKEFEWVPGLI